MIPALPAETEPMLLAQPVTARFWVWNPDSEKFDISRRTTIPAGMTVHFVPIDDILAELRENQR